MHQNKKTYVTIPNKGDYELSDLLNTINYLRGLKWTYKLWTPAPALIEKSGGSSRQYVGQNYDPKYFDLVDEGWTHDHCEICSNTISNKEGFCDIDGYKTDNNEWLCRDCYELFIKSDDIQETIKSLKTST